MIIAENGISSLEHVLSVIRDIKLQRKMDASKYSLNFCGFAIRTVESGTMMYALNVRREPFLAL